MWWAVHLLEKGEAKLIEITYFAGPSIPAVSLVGLLDKPGWNRGMPEDVRVFYEHSKPFHGAGVTAAVQYEGVPAGYMVEWDDQHVEKCLFVPDLYSP